MTSPSDKPVTPGYAGDPPDETATERVELHAPVDCSNFAKVSILASGKKLIIGAVPVEMDQAQAYVLAAWLICQGRRLAPAGQHDFGDILEAIENELYEQGEHDDAGA